MTGNKILFKLLCALVVLVLTFSVVVPTLAQSELPPSGETPTPTATHVVAETQTEMQSNTPTTPAETKPLSETTAIPDGINLTALLVTETPPADAAMLSLSVADQPEADQVIPPLYTDASDGNFSDKCNAYWYAESMMDYRLYDYPNNGYIFKLKPSLFPSDPGRYEVQHWIGGEKLYWRIPIGTLYRLIGARIELTNSPNWTIDAGSFSVDRVNFSNFTEQAVQFLKPSGANPTLAGNIITIGNMPADSNTMVMFTGTPNPGVNIREEEFRLGAALYGTFVQGGGAPGCDITIPPAQVISSEVCKLQLAGQTVFPISASDITVRDKWDDHGAIQIIREQFIRTSPPQEGEVNADGWGGYPDRYLRLYGGVDVAVYDAVYTATAVQGFKFAGVPGTIITGQSAGMGQLYNAGYTQKVEWPENSHAVLSSDGKTLTFFMTKMPAKSGFAFGLPTVPDGSGQAYVINESLTSSRSSCLAAITGKVFWDKNEDGAYNDVDTMVNNYTVTLIDASAQAIATTTTDVNGNYRFDELVAGDYRVQITVNSPFTGHSTPLFIDVSVALQETSENNNFGLIVMNPTPTPTQPPAETVTPDPTATPAPTANPVVVAPIIPVTGGTGGGTGYVQPNPIVIKPAGTVPLIPVTGAATGDDSTVYGWLTVACFVLVLLSGTGLVFSRKRARQ